MFERSNISFSIELNHTFPIFIYIDSIQSANIYQTQMYIKKMFECLNVTQYFIHSFIQVSVY